MADEEDLTGRLSDNQSVISGTTEDYNSPGNISKLLMLQAVQKSDEACSPVIGFAGEIIKSKGEIIKSQDQNKDPGSPAIDEDAVSIVSVSLLSPDLSRKATSWGKSLPTEVKSQAKGDNLWREVTRGRRSSSQVSPVVDCSQGSDQSQSLLQPPVPLDQKGNEYLTKVCDSLDKLYHQVKSSVGADGKQELCTLEMLLENQADFLNAHNTGLPGPIARDWSLKMKKLLVLIHDGHEIERDKLSSKVKVKGQTKKQKESVRKELILLGQRQKKLLTLFQKQKEINKVLQNPCSGDVNKKLTNIRSMTSQVRPTDGRIVNLSEPNHKKIRVEGNVVQDELVYSQTDDIELTQPYLQDDLSPLTRNQTNAVQKSEDTSQINRNQTNAVQKSEDTSQINRNQTNAVKKSEDTSQINRNQERIVQDIFISQTNLSGEASKVFPETFKDISHTTTTQADDVQGSRKDISPVQNQLNDDGEDLHRRQRQSQIPPITQTSVVNGADVNLGWKRKHEFPDKVGGSKKLSSDNQSLKKSECMGTRIELMGDDTKISTVDVECANTNASSNSATNNMSGKQFVKSNSLVSILDNCGAMGNSVKKQLPKSLQILKPANSQSANLGNAKVSKPSTQVIIVKQSGPKKCSGKQDNVFPKSSQISNNSSSFLNVNNKSIFPNVRADTTVTIDNDSNQNNPKDQGFQNILRSSQTEVNIIDNISPRMNPHNQRQASGWRLAHEMSHKGIRSDLNCALPANLNHSSVRKNHLQNQDISIQPSMKPKNKDSGPLLGGKPLLQKSQTGSKGDSLQVNMNTCNQGSTPSFITLHQLLQTGVVQPGKNVLSTTIKDKTYWASLTSDGKLHAEQMTFMTPLSWISTISGVKASKKFVYKKVLYQGRPLCFYQENQPSCQGSTNSCDLTTKNDLQSTAPAVFPRLAEVFKGGCKIRLIEDFELVPSETILPHDFWTSDFHSCQIRSEILGNFDRW